MVPFKCGDFSTCDAPCPGGPKTLTTPEIIGEKRRGKVTKEILFLHDNAPAHRALATQKKLT
jgi:hypothetical protein